MINLQTTVFFMNDKKQNVDFEVVSKSYIDTFGRDYINEDHFAEYWAYQSLMDSIPNDKFDDYMVRNGAKLQISEDIFESEKAYQFGDIADIDIAKKCGFGVISFLRGEYEGQLALYPVRDFDLRVQFFAYAVLTYGYIDNPVYDHLFKDEKYVKMVLGEDTFGELSEKIQEINKKSF